VNIDSNPYAAPRYNDPEPAPPVGSAVSRAMARWVGVEYAIGVCHGIVDLVGDWQRFSGLSVGGARLAGMMFAQFVPVAFHGLLALPFLSGSLRYRRVALIFQALALLAVTGGALFRHLRGWPLPMQNLMVSLPGTAALFVLLTGKPARWRLKVGAALVCTWVVALALADINALMR